MRLQATYAGKDRNGHHMLKDVTGDLVRDHHYINGERGNWPEGIHPGDRVAFFASPHNTKNGPRITDIREMEVIG